MAGLNSTVLQRGFTTPLRGVEAVRNAMTAKRSGVGKWAFTFILGCAVNHSHVRGAGPVPDCGHAYRSYQITLACFEIVEALKSHHEANVPAAIARAKEVGCGPSMLEVAKTRWAEIDDEVALKNRESGELEMEAPACLAAEMERVNRDKEAPTAVEPVVPTAPAYAPEITSPAEVASAHLVTGAGERFCKRVERELEDGVRNLPKVVDHEMVIVAMTARGCDVTIFCSLRNYAKVEIPTRALNTSRNARSRHWAQIRKRAAFWTTLVRTPRTIGTSSTSMLKSSSSAKLVSGQGPGGGPYGSAETAPRCYRLKDLPRASAKREPRALTRERASRVSCHRGRRATT